MSLLPCLSSLWRHWDIFLAHRQRKVSVVTKAKARVQNLGTAWSGWEAPENQLAPSGATLFRKPRSRSTATFQLSQLSRPGPSLHTN